MGARGPQPDSNIKALPAPRQQRPMPLRGMSEKSRAVWMKIINAYPVDHFKPQHLGLLRMYCEADALNKIAEKEARKVNYSHTNTKTLVTKESHWVGIMDKMAGRAQSLATKLGLNKNSTMAGRSKDGAGENQKPKSKRDHLLGGNN